MNDIKQQIRDKVLNKIGRINSRIFQWDTFFNTELYKSICDATSFIHNDRIFFSEKVYCIMNDIKIRPVCLICGKERPFRMFKYGYIPYCIDQKCQRKIVQWKSSSIEKIKTNREIKFNFIRKYSNRDYVTRSHEDILVFIDQKLLTTKFGSSHHFVDSLCYKLNSDILCSVLELTHDLLPVDKNHNEWSQRFYIIKYNLKQLPVCSFCGKKTKYTNLVKGYQKTCSVACSNQLYAPSQRISLHLGVIADSLKKQNFELLNGDNIIGLNRTEMELKCGKCNTIFKKFLSNGRWQNVNCDICNPRPVSQGETDIQEFLRSNNIDIRINCRATIPPLELDIVIPQHDLAIEYNGIYWHSEINNKDKKYHVNKTDRCLTANIQLLHIFENEWLNKPEIIKSIIKNKLNISTYKIYARKCIVKEISNNDARLFLEQNHLQGFVNASINIGLSFNEELCAVMSFGKRKINKTIVQKWEMLRFANKIHYNVIGGASKLLTYFERKCKPNQLLSYADRRYSNGKLYDKLGFVQDHVSLPNYWYFKNSADGIINRMNFQKHKLSKILPIFDPNLSEWENMKNNGYDRIWDCGNLVFVKNYPPVQ